MSEPREGMAAAKRRVGISRRGFVRGVGLLIAGGWLGVAGRSVRSGDVAADAAPPVHALGQAAFAVYVGDSFRVAGPTAAPLDMQLVDVADRRPRADWHHGGESFALVFRGSGDRALPQETYQFSHPALGTFPLFIVPGLAGSGGVNHEAMINRLPTDERGA